MQDYLGRLSYLWMIREQQMIEVHLKKASQSIPSRTRTKKEKQTKIKLKQLFWIYISK